MPSNLLLNHVDDVLQEMHWALRELLVVGLQHLVEVDKLISPRQRPARKVEDRCPPVSAAVAHAEFRELDQRRAVLWGYRLLQHNAAALAWRARRHEGVLPSRRARHVPHRLARVDEADHALALLLDFMLEVDADKLQQYHDRRHCTPPSPPNLARCEPLRLLLVLALVCPIILLIASPKFPPR
eukprot:CAMPEP_0180195832 /NCGR_PEP_ID=MMETSP0987-20121128/3793_1 /TAXON_ID=697907 /ORGANISM="non described non described, Strain CCMP2293" /LENGTH=183 /DNA_ID=CAMNT_0022150691 /DNA_START=557 /DNA_END=1105 /DNA_ORIENTATION=+